MSTDEVLLALRVVSELLALIERALRDGETVTKRDLALAFARADEAEKAWREANGGAHGPEDGS